MIIKCQVSVSSLLLGIPKASRGYYDHKVSDVGTSSVIRYPKGQEKENNLCRIICRCCFSCSPNISAECLP